MGRRKKHVQVSQDAILAALQETGGGELPTIAQYFDVSETTARRKLDGLVYQGKLKVEPGRKGHGAGLPRFYMPVEVA
jgi:predicted ArsR family transcriptional regulator